MIEPRYPTSPQYRRRQEGISPGKAVFWIVLVLGGLSMGYEFYSSVQEDIAGQGRPAEEDLGERTVKAPVEAAVDGAHSRVTPPGEKPTTTKTAEPPPAEPAPPAKTAPEEKHVAHAAAPVPPRAEKAEKKESVPPAEKHPPKDATDKHGESTPGAKTLADHPKGDAPHKAGVKASAQAKGSVPPAGETKTTAETRATAENEPPEEPAPAVDLTFYQQLPNRKFQLPPDKPLPKTVQQPVEAATATDAPTEVKPAPVETKPAPTTTKPAPVEAKPAPAPTKPAPVEAKPAPAKHTPVEAKPAAAPTKPAPVEAKPAPASQPAPSTPTDKGGNLASVTAAIERTLAREGGARTTAPPGATRPHASGGNIIIKRRGDEESIISLPGGQNAAPTGGFTVQLGSFPDGERAAALARRLQANGIPARVDHVNGGASPFRVRAGSFPSREEASKSAIRWRMDGTQPMVVQAR